jgi:mRNA interferase MazF
MDKAASSIRRGDIYYANLDPVVGSEQGGTRPVLIIQNDVGNKYSPTLIVAAITTRTDKRILPTHVPLTEHLHGLRRDSVILLEQIRTLDRMRLEQRVGALSSETMKKIDLALIISVGLENNRGIRADNTDATSLT